MCIVILAVVTVRSAARFTVYIYISKTIRNYILICICVLS